MKVKGVLILILVALVGASVGMFAKAKLNWHVTASEGKQSAFTLTSRVTHTDGNGTRRVDEKVRYVSSDGSWRVVLTNAQGQHSEYFFQTGRGFFNVNHKEKILQQRKEGTAFPPIARTAEQLSKDPQFIGTETLLRLTTYILRVKDEETGLPLLDAYYAVELGNIPLKVINYAQGKPTILDEPVNVSFGEPEASLVKGPNYPVAPS